MASNGVYDPNLDRYYPNSIETWDDFTGSSSGDDWDSISSWNGTPNLPLTFLTGIIDMGSSDTTNYYLDIRATDPANVTVYYGDTVDSSGGEIDSANSVSVTPSDTTITAKKGRYWQFEISINSSSAGDAPFIESIQYNLDRSTIQSFVTDVDTSSLSGSTGLRQLDSAGGIKSVTSAIVQVQIPVNVYVANGYVADSYVSDTVVDTPICYTDKSTTPITLNIFDIDAFGKRKRVDATIDAMLTGLPSIKSDETGSIIGG